MSDFIIDARGRKLTKRKLNVMDQVRLLRAMGPEQSNNEPYANIVNMAAMVADIDGTPVVFPTNERQIDMAITAIGDDGFAAIMVDMKRQVDEVMAAAEAAAQGGEAKPADPLPPSA